MIQRSSDAVEAIAKNSSDLGIRLVPDQDWKSLLKESRIKTSELLASVGLDHHPLADAESEKLFELRVPLPYRQKIRHGDPNDPLLLQVLPSSLEHLNVEGYSNDPLDEGDYSPVPGLIHKYPSRVLLITNQSCAIHCRYCFRRNFPYQAHRRGLNDWQEVLDYISSQEDVNEVILSGGDPLMMTNDALTKLFNALETLPQIKRVRIHTRLISSLPQRIDQGLLALFSRCKMRIVIVLHCNHANELCELTRKACEALRHTGVLLLNQSVLLKGVNDNPNTLKALSEALFEHHVQPYYLFTLDKVSGAAHFDLPLARSKAIYQGLIEQVPGFLCPRLVAEIPGKKSKTPLNFGDL